MKERIELTADKVSKFKSYLSKGIPGTNIIAFI